MTYKYKVGDLLEVTAKRSGHGFKIGKVVRVRELSDNLKEIAYVCWDLKERDFWWLSPDEVKLHTPAENA
jgi:hypothetical protein